MKRDELICSKTIYGFVLYYFTTVLDSTILWSCRNTHNTKQLVFWSNTIKLIFTNEILEVSISCRNTI